MAASHTVFAVRDRYCSVLHFVKSLKDGNHCNSLSKRIRLQTVEVKRFLETAATQKLKLLLIGFATDLLLVFGLCLKTSYATELRCRE